MLGEDEDSKYVLAEILRDREAKGWPPADFCPNCIRSSVQLSQWMHKSSRFEGALRAKKDQAVGQRVPFWIAIGILGILWISESGKARQSESRLEQARPVLLNLQQQRHRLDRERVNEVLPDIDLAIRGLKAALQEPESFNEGRPERP